MFKISRRRSAHWAISCIAVVARCTYTNCFESVGDPVPTAQHWLKLATRPADFDENSVWAYVQKLKEIESGKPFNFVCLLFEDIWFI